MSVVSGPIYQVAWVVDDITASEKWLGDVLGVQAWTRFDDIRYRPDSWTYRGQPCESTIHVALGYAGRQQVELIQPVDGVNLYSEHLDRCGPSLHHVAWLVDDVDAVVAAAAAQGIETVQQGSIAGCHYAYLDGQAGGAGYIELMQLTDNMRAFFDSLIPEDAR